jgi:hypothetical protein
MNELSAREQIVRMEEKLAEIEGNMNKEHPIIKDREKTTLLTISKGLLELLKQALDNT